MVPLGEVVEINPRGLRLAAAEEVSFVGMAQLDAQSAAAIPLEERHFADVAKGYTLFEDGDVLAAKITPCWENGKIGQAHLSRRWGAGSTEFHVLRPRSGVDARYLLHFLRREEINRAGQLRMTGSGGQRRVPAAFLAGLALPLPVLEEQRRIAAILDQADAIRTKRRQVLAYLDALPELAWADLFGAAPAVLTVEGVLASRGAMRTGPFGSQLLKEELVDDGVPVLGLDNVVSNRFRWGGGRFVTAEKYAALQRYEVYPGDVLISIMGTVGRCVVVPAGTPQCINTKHICAITVDESLILPEVLRAAFLWYPPARSHLARQSKGAIMAGLNMGIIKSLPLPDISMPRQIEFVRTLHAVDEARTQVERQLAADDELFASLQARAFRGEL